MRARSSMRRTARRRVLDGQAAAQCAEMWRPRPRISPTPEESMKGDAREVQRQQLRQAVIHLGVDFLAACDWAAWWSISPLR